MRITVTDTPFDPWGEVARYQGGLAAGQYGAASVFVGTMRDFNEGSGVSAMTLEHYPGMTEASLRDIAAKATERHQLLDVLVIHRTGPLEPGEPIVLVAAWAAHRAASFEGCREIVEYLKSRAPFWKKETLATGSRWVEHNTPA